MLQDIAVVTGAELISEDLGKLSTVDIASLGKARRVVSNKDNTTRRRGSKEEIQKRISQLKSQIQKTDSILIKRSCRNVW